jgi:serine phosphatase RsbU (regulator of sigma subunit)
MSAPSERPLRVLVVDDDPGINGLLAARMEARGYAVETASNGVEALERIAAAPPDFMLLDVSMPELGGLEVLDAIRAGQLDIAVVMTTAFGSEQIAIEALRRGADDYLRKPFEPHELRAVVERTASRLLLRRQNEELRRQLDAELARAAEIQAGLLPTTPPRLPGYQLAARCLPAREVGGDFYDWDWQPDADALTITLGDVMGKGVPAALLMATARAALRAVALDQPPARAVALVERALTGDLERAGSFVTLLHARLELPANRLSFVDAGHGHAFVLRADGTAAALAPRGLPLGVGISLGVAETRDAGALTLEPGEALVLYSDGLLDACPAAALDQPALVGALRDARSAEEMAARLVALAERAGPLPDDLTVMVLRRHP